MKIREKKHKKSKKKRLQLVGKTAVVQKDEEQKRGAVLQNETLVFFLSCVCVALMLKGLLWNYCAVWDVAYRDDWTRELLLVSLVTAAVGVLGRLSRLIPWLTVAAFGVVGIVSKSRLWEGAKELANPVLKSWCDYYKINQRQYHLGGGSQLDYTVLYIAFGLALLFVMVMRQKRGRFLILLPGILMLVLCLLVGKGPDVEGCIYLLSGVLPAYAYAGIANSILTAVIFLLGVGVFTFWGDKTLAPNVLDRHDELWDYQKNLETKIGDFFDDISGGLSIFGGSNGADGHITNRSPYFTGKEIFQVTVSEQPNTKYYFRGFVGDTYEDGQWYPVNEEAFEEKVRSWNYTEGDAGKYILNQSFEYALNPTTEYETNIDRLREMEILYIDDSEDYAYFPYFTHLYLTGLNEFKVEADAEIKKPEELTHVSFYTAEHFAEDNGDAFIWMDDMQGALMANYEEEVLQKYTEVPDTGLNRLWALADSWKEHGYGVQQYDVNYALQIKKVTEELAERAEYSRDLKRVPSGTDVVENFLFENREGFCIHYASAGTLLLRLLGVPARYVSGYAVEPRDFEKNPDGTYSATVKDTMGHAWVEVYMAGKGWIPVEVTEGVDSMNYGMDKEDVKLAQYMRQWFGTKPQEEKKPEPEKAPEQSTQQQQLPQTKKPVNTSTSTDEVEPVKVLLYVILAMFVMTGMGILIYRKRKELERKRRFYSRNGKVAVLEISHEIARKLSYAGIVRNKNLPDEEYLSIAEEKLDFLEKGELAEFLRIAEKSVFSEYVPTVDEVKYGRQIYHKIVTGLREKKKGNI